MLFHLGALWRLNELGILPRLAQVSAVSTGAIVAGLLGVRWSRLEFDAAGVARNFAAQVAEPLLDLAGRTIDVSTLLIGLLNPLGKGNVPGPMRDALGRLYAGARLADLPPRPAIVVCATNLDSESQWRFQREAMGDHRVGMLAQPALDLATAVGASLAMPPLPAVHIDAGGSAGRVPLIDGSVYDMLALESAWRRYDVLLVSDGTSRDGSPRHDSTADGFMESIARTMDLVAAQSHRVMRRQVFDLFALGARRGAYWSLRSGMSSVEAAPALAVRDEMVESLAATPARLRGLPQDVQQRLVNLGYAVADAALRRRVIADAPPAGWPYPDVAM
jgi:NTE family protein